MKNAEEIVDNIKFPLVTSSVVFVWHLEGSFCVLFSLLVLLISVEDHPKIAQESYVLLIVLIKVSEIFFFNFSIIALKRLLIVPRWQFCKANVDVVGHLFNIWDWWLMMICPRFQSWVNRKCLANFSFLLSFFSSLKPPFSRFQCDDRFLNFLL